MLHLHGFDHRQALARFDRLAVLDRDRDEAPVHRRADRGIALLRPGLGLRERIDELNERLPPAGESVHAALGLMERDLVARLAALRSSRPDRRWRPRRDAPALGRHRP